MAITIRKSIYLPPNKINEGYRTALEEELQKLVGTCVETYGYIQEISPDIKITGNLVSSANTGVNFHVEVKAQTLLPKEKGVYTGTVCMIMPTGILVLCGKMKIYIPGNKMEKYTYVKNKKAFIHPDDGELFLKDTLEVVMDQLTFENETFVCVGSLVKKIT